MAKKIGSSKHPAVVRVQTTQWAQEILSTCDRNNCKVVIGVEPDKPENIADVEKLLNPLAPSRIPVNTGRNGSCPCGSKRKYKRCCGAR